MVMLMLSGSWTFFFSSLCCSLPNAATMGFLFTVFLTEVVLWVFS